MKVEYKVRPVVRYVVTEYVEAENGGGCSAIGEFDNEQCAERVRSLFEDTSDVYKPGEGSSYVLVPQGMHDAKEKPVWYATTLDEAIARQESLHADPDGHGWNIYRRVRSV